ncbi:hypothetical protein MVEN_01880200 [Mycena venus]|uniref:Mid2 domain-containing protein n=1 Tax=Mycena venus TaxID=2733690 RepID=A0A8H6XJ33_9AGAR|nr:hypothetical protein MVEN_01880200 [Mycena venus]
MWGSTTLLLLLALCLRAPELGHGEEDNPPGHTPSACETQDDLGTALETTDYAKTNVTCFYASGDECNYFLSNGSLSLGAETCPNFLASVGVITSVGVFTPTSATPDVSTGTTSDVFITTEAAATSHSVVGTGSPTSTTSGRSTSESASFTSPASQTTQLSRNSGIPTVVAHRHKLSRAKVVGIVLGVATVPTVIALFFLFKRRRIRHRTAALLEIESNRAAAIISPFTLIPQMNSPTSQDATQDTDSDVRSISASTIARQQLETQLLAATEKMIDLQDQERLSVGSATNSSGIRRMWRSVVQRTASTGPLTDVEEQLQSARDQINMLVERINASEANSNSAWSGAVDEPPPEYH